MRLICLLNIVRLDLFIIGLVRRFIPMISTQKHYERVPIQPDTAHFNLFSSILINMKSWESKNARDILKDPYVIRINDQAAITIFLNISNSSIFVTLPSLFLSTAPINFLTSISVTFLPAFSCLKASAITFLSSP